MKLLTKTALGYTVVALVIFIAGGWIMFARIVSTIAQSTDQYLESREESVTTHLINHVAVEALQAFEPQRTVIYWYWSVVIVQVCFFARPCAGLFCISFFVWFKTVRLLIAREKNRWVYIESV